MTKKLDGQDSLDRTDSLQTIMDAGRHVAEAFSAIDIVIANRLGVQRNDLRCLWLLKHGPVTAGEVAARTGLTSGSVTALLDRLECTGYVERSRSISDQRSVAITLTACGHAKMHQLQDKIEASIRAFFDDRTADEVAWTGNTLKLFAAALDQSAIAFEGDTAPD